MKKRNPLPLLGGVGLARSGNLGDLARPLRETRWVKGRKSGQQLEW